MSCDNQVLFKLKNGEQMVFSVVDKDDFLDLIRQLSSLFGTWIQIGDDWAVRKSEIASIQYCEGGYDGSHWNY